MKTSFQNCPAKITSTVVILTAVLAFVGCGSGIPEIVPVSGTITVNGKKPYERVLVKFYQLQSGLDGNTVASGVTDENGNYTLMLPGKDTPGACACECAVTITEGPMPDEIRKSGNDQITATLYLDSLKKKFRPIPIPYTRMGDTPLQVKVESGVETYDFDVKF